MTDDNILLARQGRVLTVTLNRPDDRNAIVAGMLERLMEVFDAAARDPGTGVVVLRGAGRHFCPGASLQGLTAGTATRTRDEIATVAKEIGRLAVLISDMPKPSIAMIRGVTAGGGVALAAACDFRLAGPDARIGFGYSRTGLSGDVGATLSLVRVLGPAKAREFMYLGPVLDAEAAQAIGLVNRVVADADLEAETMAFAERLAQVSPQAMAGMKQNIAAAVELSAAQALDVEAENFAACYVSLNHREAARAFLEKRAPQFDFQAPVEPAAWPAAD